MRCDIDTIAAAQYDVCYMAGTEISTNGTFAVTDENDLPVDLSLASLQLQVKYKPEDPLTRALIVLKTTDATLTVGGVYFNNLSLKRYNLNINIL